MQFTHLHVHTIYSMKDGLCKIPELVAKAKAEGAPAVAKTDHGFLYGTPQFLQECRKQGVKPIIGVEAYVAHNGIHKKEKTEQKAMHLTLLAQNKIGYKNLLKLATLAGTTGFYYVPRIDLDLLREYAEGIICLTGCMYGVLNRPRWEQGWPDNASAVNLDKLMIAFDPEHLYLELQDAAMPVQKQLNPWLVNIGKEYNLPVVVANDVHFLDKEDALLHDIVFALRTGKTLADLEVRETPKQIYYKTEEEMRALGLPDEAYTNTLKIADMVEEYDIGVGEKHYPAY